MIITRIYSIQQHIFCPLTVLSGICRYDVYYSNENCWPSLSKNKRNNFSPYDKLSVTWGYKISRFQIYDNHGFDKAKPWYTLQFIKWNCIKYQSFNINSFYHTSNILFCLDFSVMVDCAFPDLSYFAIPLWFLRLLLSSACYVLNVHGIKN